MSDYVLTGRSVTLDDLAAGLVPAELSKCRRCGVTNKGRWTGWGWLLRHRIARACDPSRRARVAAFYAHRHQLRPGEEPF